MTRWLSVLASSIRNRQRRSCSNRQCELPPCRDSYVPGQPLSARNPIVEPILLISNKKKIINKKWFRASLHFFDISPCSGFTGGFESGVGDEAPSFAHPVALTNPHRLQPLSPLRFGASPGLTSSFSSPLSSPTRNNNNKLLFCKLQYLKID